MRKLGLPVVLLLVISCSENNTGVSIPAGDPTGDWVLTTAEISDPCNRSSDSPLVQDARVARNGSHYELQIEGQPCSSPIVFTATTPQGVGGYGLASAVSETSYLGCAYTTRTVLSIHITQDTIEGLVKDEMSLKPSGYSGYYGYSYPAGCPMNCEVRKAIHSERCDGCFDGCL